MKLGSKNIPLYEQMVTWSLLLWGNNAKYNAGLISFVVSAFDERFISTSSLAATAVVGSFASARLTAAFSIFVDTCIGTLSAANVLPMMSPPAFVKMRCCSPAEDCNNALSLVLLLLAWCMPFLAASAEVGKYFLAKSPSDGAAPSCRRGFCVSCARFLR